MIGMGTFMLQHGAPVVQCSVSLRETKTCTCSFFTFEAWSTRVFKRLGAVPTLRVEKTRVSFYRFRAQASEVGIVSPPVTGGTRIVDDVLEQYDCVIVGGGISGLCTAQTSIGRNLTVGGSSKFPASRRGILSPQGLGCCSRKTSGGKGVRHFVTSATQVPQNVDLPSVLPRKKKKPKANLKQGSKKKFTKKPNEYIIREPDNGFLVKRLIPVAHDVLEAKAILTKGVELLFETSTVWTCRFCTEVHVGSSGHTLQTCRGPRNDERQSLHVWIKATINDILVPVQAYHLRDRLALPMAHDCRFNVDRISAVDELCIQAGVDIPEYPTRRYDSDFVESSLRETQGASSLIGYEFSHVLRHGNFDPTEAPTQKLEETSSTGEENIEGSRVDAPAGYQVHEDIAVEHHNSGREPLVESSNESFTKEGRTPLVDVTSEDDLQTIAEKTLQAWDRMRAGARKLKNKYRVLVCGYCPEVHVGPKGHRAQVCGAFKHQWRNGQHGWQTASVDDLIPPQYVWHVRDKSRPQLHQALIRFYGKTPAVVELCVQAGAPVPDDCKPLMRLDIVIPGIDELEHVF